ncbi:MAG: DUF1361 domain-containing protein [Jaaginema sp. PMC 1079.18]|nr:DUF1361 domain-containing protein [Jaaginema sp. PMC 1080.18]MEC4853397.1 DUF1361 domain-containing protein [Jaaginema sp. PMC 1079.18]MEC4867220.1 DUF1361 domain-containing protein [Jaaginema sp. PMC 1078.18]
MVYTFWQMYGALRIHSGWILWNLFLAFIPLVLSFWLFQRQKIRRSLLWWVILAIFMLFLPNAPYLLTDIIHLIRATEAGYYSTFVIALFIIPVHLSAIFLGFQAYTLSVMNIGFYLRKIGLRRFIIPTELFVHVLSAIGVFMGRFQRFNSWDIVNNPDTIAYSLIRNLSDKEPIFVIGITFVVLTVLYWLLKQVNLGLWLRFQQIKARRQKTQHHEV